MNKPIVARIVEYSFMTLATAIMGFIVFWYAFPINPVTFHSDQLVIETPQVRPGGELQYSLPVEKFGIYPSTISGTLVSENGQTAYALRPESGALPPGNYKSLHQEVLIPKKVNPQKYFYSRIYVYHVNPGQDVVRYYRTPLFEVIP